MLNPTLSPSASRRSSGFSRRDLLKGLTAGFGGTLAAPFFARPASGAPVTSNACLSSSAPPLLLTGSLVNQVTATGLASYGPGWIFVLTQNSSSGTPTYDLEFVDAHNLNTVFSFVNYYNQPLPTTPFLQPVVDDTYVYTASGSTVYVIPLANPMSYAFSFPVSSTVVGNLVLAGGLLLVATADGKLSAFTAKTRVPLWPKPISVGAMTDIAVGGNTIYVSANNQLNAYSLLDGSAVSSFSVSSVPTGRLTVSNDSVFVTSSDAIRSYSITKGGVLNWSYSFTGPGTLPATLYTGFLYTVDTGGNLHEIQAGSTQGQATSRSPLALSPDIDPTQPLVFEDGVVYGASPGAKSGSTSTLTIYPMVLATGAISAYCTNLTGRFLGVENGTCFFTHNSGASVAGVALAPQVNGFFAESELMADNYPAGVKAQGTSFRTHVRLQDANNNPRVNKAVKIWANEPVTLSIDSTVPGAPPTMVALTGGPSSAYWATTDGAGEISIVCTATNITCPALYLWGSFMYQVQGEYMVLYPDHGTVGQLSTKSAGDLTSATAYDNTSLLQSQYQGNADIIAQHIQNTLGGVATALVTPAGSGLTSTPPGAPGHRKPPLLGVDPNKYLAYPGSSPNLLSLSNYSQDVTATYRQFSPAKKAYNVNLDPSSSSTALTAELSLGSFLGGLEDLVKNVVTAAEDEAQKVTAVLVTVLEDAVQHVIQVAEGYYQFVVNTVEAAVASVAAVLSTVANSIESAIQWLSYLFDWTDMVNNAIQISAAVTTRLQNFATWIGSEAANVNDYLDQIFGDVTGAITKAFGTIINDIGGSSLQSHQQNGNNPQQIYGANGASSYTKTQWMNSKVKNNVNGASSSSLSLTAGLGDDSAFSAMLQAGEQFIQTLQSKLSTDYQNLPGNLQSQFTKLGSLMQDPGAFVTNALTTVLTIVQDGAILVIDFIKDVFEAFVSALSALLTGAITLMTQPINIPVITELWSVITASQPSFVLSILNVASLVLAIPSTIIIKAAGGAQAGLKDNSDNGAFAVALLETGLVLAGLIYAGFDAFADVSNQDSNSGVALASLALSCVTLGLGLPLLLPTGDAASFIWYALSALPIVNGAYLYLANEYKYGSYELHNKQNGSTNGLFGVAMLVTSGILCFADPTDFKGNNYLTLLQNLFTYIPYFGKAFAEGPANTPVRIGVGAVDAVGDVTATILGAIPH